MYWGGVGYGEKRVQPHCTRVPTASPVLSEACVLEAGLMGVSPVSVK